MNVVSQVELRSTPNTDVVLATAGCCNNQGRPSSVWSRSADGEVGATTVPHTPVSLAPNQAIRCQREAV